MTRCGLIASLGTDKSALESRLQAMDLAIALTSEGELALNAMSVKHISPAELITARRLKTLAQHSLKARDRFMARICNGEKLDGIDWPALFLEDNYLLFFRDVFFAQDLGFRLREEGIETVSWENPGDPSNGASGEIFKRTLSSVDGLKIFETSDTSTTFSCQKFFDPLTRLRRRLRDRVLADPVAGQVVAVFSTRQWERFRTSLLDLKTTFGRSFQLWYLGSAGKDLVRWSKAHHIRLHCIPYPTRVDPDIAQFFQGHREAYSNPVKVGHREAYFDRVRHQLAEDLDCPALASGELESSIELFLEYTLPHTAQWGRNFRSLLETSRPSFIVGSAAYTYQTALPYHVASHLGLISVALSHTYVSGDHSPVSSTYLACRNRFERRSFRRSFPDEDKVLYCHNSSDRLSYQPDPTVHVDAKTKPLVAMLTASPTIGRFLMPTLDTGEFARTLRALASPPTALSGIDFAFKSHPRFDISAPLSKSLGSTNVRVVAATASVTSLLEASWLVVVFNHYGGVVVDAIASGKPIIFLDSAGYSYPHVETLGFEAGDVVQTVEEFWDLLERLMTDRELYQALEQKCDLFASSYLNSSSESLGSSLTQLLT